MANDPINQQPFQGFVRLSGAPEESVSALGPLSHLVGTWVGNQGWNMIAVPVTADDGSETFKLEVMRMTETITFSPIGAPVPNKGYPEPTFVVGVQYELRVSDSETNQPLHIENGMWLLLDKDPIPGAPSIARQSVIPHGDSLLALGTYSIKKGPPDIPDINAVPFPGPKPEAGYTDAWIGPPVDGFSRINPNQTLKDFIKQQDILETTTLIVSTENDGGIVNIPFIVRNANATAFQCVFWIEKVKSATGDVFEQLQYSQQTNLNFISQFGNPSQLIMWPHVNINTLVKQ